MKTFKEVKEGDILYIIDRHYDESYIEKIISFSSSDMYYLIHTDSIINTEHRPFYNYKERIPYTDIHKVECNNTDFYITTDITLFKQHLSKTRKDITRILDMIYEYENLCRTN